MAVNFCESKTKENLMRAFAGESMARNRYTFAAEKAKQAKNYVVEAVFKFTADQEKEHAEIFLNHLAQCSGENLEINGAAYPVSTETSVLELLRFAQHNEYEESDDAYKYFSDTAKQEGFEQIATDFKNIAEIERNHGDRFGMLADLIESNRLFVADAEIDWMCLNCGYIYKGTEAPEQCPVCKENRGYYIRLELAPYSFRKMQQGAEQVENS